jgi:hypothetical protein
LIGQNEKVFQSNTNFDQTNIGYETTTDYNENNAYYRAKEWKR